ncbi:hypothetical protein FS837_010181 [Tulasnella sp. UAMH 9824]|nr:hypothetical protein FS837_010181 [Tulasnella sp. UAMH 9824]
MAQSKETQRLIVGVWRKVKTTKGGYVLSRHTPSPEECQLNHLCDRVLLRIILKEVGVPLSETVGSQKLLLVAHDITRALQAIYEAGVLHRDISYGNILLLPEENYREGNVAFIVDFGLALRVDPSSGILIPSDSKPHHHFTGTLPYMAHDYLSYNILPATSTSPLPVEPLVHHDLESLFWVLLHVAIRFAHHHPPDDDTWGGNIVKVLLHGTTHDVVFYKFGILAKPQNISLEGQFASFRSFLVTFGKQLSQKLDCRSISLPDAQELFDHVAAGAQTELKNLQTEPSHIPPSVSKSPSTLSLVSQTPTTSQKRPSGDLLEPASNDRSKGLDDTKERDRKRGGFVVSKDESLAVVSTALLDRTSALRYRETFRGRKETRCLEPAALAVEMRDRQGLGAFRLEASCHFGVYHASAHLPPRTAPSPTHISVVSVLLFSPPGVESKETLGSVIAIDLGSIYSSVGWTSGNHRRRPEPPYRSLMCSLIDEQRRVGNANNAYHDTQRVTSRLPDIKDTKHSPAFSVIDSPTPRTSAIATLNIRSHPNAARRQGEL